ncbi:hypothetical protein, partial [Comamonas thiooxydans]|uniref:hypothetical protein n=1 Tax=Comamonas thiooxydans TaxID=363952 RepID=UPI00325FA8D7
MTSSFSWRGLREDALVQSELHVSTRQAGQLLKIANQRAGATVAGATLAGVAGVTGAAGCAGAAGAPLAGC